MTVKIGLTGGMGAGKSTALQFFKDKGMMTLSADCISRELVKPTLPAYRTIITHFGQSYLNADKTLNRHALRIYISKHPNERKWLDNLLHPLIRKAIEEQMKKATTPIVVAEIPLLTKREDYPYLDRILTIETSNAIQLERVTKRDTIDIASTQKLIDTQLSSEQRIAFSDDVIINCDNLSYFYESLEKLFTIYTKDA
jgi:dephospho-CoA kinase